MECAHPSAIKLYSYLRGHVRRTLLIGTVAESQCICPSSRPYRSCRTRTSSVHAPTRACLTRLVASAKQQDQRFRNHLRSAQRRHVPGEPGLHHRHPPAASRSAVRDRGAGHHCGQGQRDSGHRDRAAAANVEQRSAQSAQQVIRQERPEKPPATVVRRGPARRGLTLLRS